MPKLSSIEINDRMAAALGDSWPIKGWWPLMVTCLTLNVPPTTLRWAMKKQRIRWAQSAPGHGSPTLISQADFLLWYVAAWTPRD